MLPREHALDLAGCERGDPRQLDRRPEGDDRALARLQQRHGRRFRAPLVGCTGRLAERIHLHPAFRHEHFHGGGVEPHVEHRADRAHIDPARRHDERMRRILRHAEIRLALLEPHAALGEPA